MVSGSHASTLDRLYAWEKKLYDEVKVGSDCNFVFYIIFCSIWQKIDPFIFSPIRFLIEGVFFSFSLVRCLEAISIKSADFFDSKNHEERILTKRELQSKVCIQESELLFRESTLFQRRSKKSETKSSNLNSRS